MGKNDYKKGKKNMKSELSFKTEKDALEYLRAENGLMESPVNPGVFWDKGKYYPSRGEYERPDYRVRRYKDGWGIHATYYYFAGTPHAPKNGRIVDNIWRIQKELNQLINQWQAKRG
jgi:hypothetical protein